MFGRVARETFQGLLRWPDLMIFGLLSFGLTLGLDILLQPWWIRIAGALQELLSGGTIAAAVALSIVQQFLLTFVSIMLTVAAVRIVLARMGGEGMSIRQGLRVGAYIRGIAAYALLYTAISLAISFGYLFLLFGAAGVSFLSVMTTGISGLSQIPTTALGATTLLILLVFVPLLVVWLLANMLVSPVIAVENSGAWASILRSWQLVRRSLSVVLGLVLSFFGLVCVLTLILSFIVSGSGTPGLLQESVTTASVSAPAISVVWSAILSALMFMVGAIFTAAWYRAVTEEPAPLPDFRP